MDNSPLILLAAGGTGGHLFPAEALGVELIRRGLRVRLATDARALRYSGLFSKDNIDVVPSETVRGRNPVSLARTAITLGYGAIVALNLVRRLQPAAVVVGGVGPLPVRIDTAGAAGLPATAETWRALGELAAAQVDPPSDTHGSGEYRKRLTATLVSRALAQAAGE